jgi:hypothetical protein
VPTATISVLPAAGHWHLGGFPVVQRARQRSVTFIACSTYFGAVCGKPSRRPYFGHGQKNTYYSMTLKMGWKVKKIRVIQHTAGRCNMQLGCSIQLKDLIINLIIYTLTLSSLPTGQ